MSGRAKYFSAEPPRREPTPITDVLGVVMEHASVSYGSNLVRLREGWRALAGATWAGTTPVAIRDEMVIVEVPDGARASVLRFEADALLRTIQEEYGPGFARGVRLRVARPSTRR